MLIVACWLASIVCQVGVGMTGSNIEWPWFALWLPFYTFWPHALLLCWGKSRKLGRIRRRKKTGIGLVSLWGSRTAVNKTSRRYSWACFLCDGCSSLSDWALNTTRSLSLVCGCWHFGRTRRVWLRGEELVLFLVQSRGSWSLRPTGGGGGGKETEPQPAKWWQWKAFRAFGLPPPFYTVYPS
jgi:hypothetical protein